jgi:NADH dehydrogenase
VARIDAASLEVLLEDGELALVLASGATHSCFGHAEWEPYAPGLKSLEDALEIRRRLLLAFECTEREDDEARRRVATRG